MSFFLRKETYLGFVGERGKRRRCYSRGTVLPALVKEVYLVGEAGEGKSSEGGAREFWSTDSEGKVRRCHLSHKKDTLIYMKEKPRAYYEGPEKIEAILENWGGGADRQ